MVALFSEVRADYRAVCGLQVAVPVQTDEDNKDSNTLPFILRLAGKQLVEIFDQTVIAFLPFEIRSKFTCTRHLCSLVRYTGNNSPSSNPNTLVAKSILSRFSNFEILLIGTGH